jgi:hypothetical protein
VANSISLVDKSLTDDEERLMVAARMGLVTYRIEEGDMWWYIGDTNVTSIYLSLFMKGANVVAFPHANVEVNVV